MAIKVVKSLAVAEDLALGLGTVEQERDIGGGELETVLYNKINAGIIPTESGATIQLDLDERYTKDEVTTSFANINGAAGQLFNVETPSTATHAVNMGYLEEQLASNMADYALKTNVLQRDNLVAYVPTTSYHPATKKYIDDLVIAAGAGDMLKLTYDIVGDGIVNEARTLSNVDTASIMTNKGITTDCNTNITVGSWECEDAGNSPSTGLGLLVVVEGSTKGILAQTYYAITAETVHVRMYNDIGSTWTDWVDQATQLNVVDNLESTASDEALSANQGRVLSENLTTLSSTNIPIGGIIMYDGAFSLIPSNWKICDGNNGTPNLSTRFIRGTAVEANIGLTGGTDSSTMPSHTHSGPNHRHTGPSHTHPGTSHTHNYSHDHPTTTTSSAGSHTHSVPSTSAKLNLSGAAGGACYAYYTSSCSQGSSTTIGGGTTGGASANHTHTLNVPYFSGNTLGGGTASSGSGGTGYTSYGGTNNTGYSGGTGDNKPVYYTLAYIKRIS